jgi:hypothetical protein
MSKETIVDMGYDLSWPLISQPGPVSEHKSSSTFSEHQTQEVTGGFDLRWPLVSQPEQPAGKMIDTRKRAA